MDAQVPQSGGQTVSGRILAATLLHEHGDTGVQTHINVMSDYLRSRGIETSTITPFSYLASAARLVYAVKAPVERLSSEAGVWWYRQWHYLFLRLALRRVLSNGDEVVVCAHCPVSAKAALEERTGLHQRVFLVVHYDLSQAEEWAIRGKVQRGGRLYRSMEQLDRETLPRLDGIVYVSQFMRDVTVAAIPGVARVPYIVIPNFLPDPPPGAPAGSANDLINIGTLEPRKNQSYLLRVLAEAKALGHRYTLTLVGDGEDRAMLGALARRLEIEDQVSFLGYQPKASRLLAGHRAYVHSSLLESSPIALIEALAAGLPVFAGRVGGIPEMFSEEVEGLFWSLDDPAEGARKVIGLLSDPARHHAMCLAAKQRFDETFRLTTLASRLTSFLSAGSPPPSPVAVLDGLVEPASAVS